MNNSCILLLEQVGINDIGIVGGKNASLGEMLQHLTRWELKFRMVGHYDSGVHRFIINQALK